MKSSQKIYSLILLQILIYNETSLKNFMMYGYIWGRSWKLYFVTLFHFCIVYKDSFSSVKLHVKVVFEVENWKAVNQSPIILWWSFLALFVHDAMIHVVKVFCWKICDSFHKINIKSQIAKIVLNLVQFFFLGTLFLGINYGFQYFEFIESIYWKKLQFYLESLIEWFYVLQENLLLFSKVSHVYKMYLI